jgi:hypothetical protein
MKERSRPLPKYPQFPFDHAYFIVCPFCSVSPHVVAYPAHNLLRGAIKNNERHDLSDPSDVSGLTFMAGDAVEDKHCTGGEFSTSQEQ